MKSFLILTLFFSFCLTGCNNNENLEQEENNNYSASRIISSENINTNIINADNTINSNNIADSNNILNQNSETEISSFSTKIYTPDDESRQNNIRITCSKLNETVVRSRKNFFFLQYCRKSYS